jgi:uncharacterized protein (TIGR04255 family)
MNNQPNISHLPYIKPPIVEAVIAIHFDTHLEQKFIEKFVRKYKKDFPFNVEIIEVLGTFNTYTNQTNSNIQKIGAKISNSDQSKIITILNTQFAVSQLAPYTDWDTFYKESKIHWGNLKKIDNKAVNRVSTRFINRIDIPIEKDGRVDLHKYFSAGLSLPPYAQAMTLQSFYINCSLLHSNKNYMHTLQLSTMPSVLIDHLSFSIDIDVFTTEQLPKHEDKIWELIYSLRKYKNDLFESCITENTRELFK